MEFIDFLLKGNYKRFYENLKEIGKEKHKSPFLMFVDAAFCSIVFGSGLSDYLNYRFYDMILKEIFKYVKIRYCLYFFLKYLL